MRKCTFEPNVDRENQVASRYLQEAPLAQNASLVYTATSAKHMIRKARSPTIRRNHTMSVTLNSIAQRPGKIQVYGRDIKPKESTVGGEEEIYTQVYTRQTHTPAPELPR